MRCVAVRETHFRKTQIKDDKGMKINGMYFFLISRKYRIDLHLKRFTSALNHISKCVPEYVEECLDLVKNQRLYLEAISIFQNSKNKDTYQKICQIYGDYLMSKKYFEDAALIFEAGNLNSEAVSAWEQSGNWNYCLALAKTVVTSPNEYSSLCR